MQKTLIQNFSKIKEVMIDARASTFPPEEILFMKTRSNNPLHDNEWPFTSITTNTDLERGFHILIFVTD